MYRRTHDFSDGIVLERARSNSVTGSCTCTLFVFDNRSPSRLLFLSGITKGCFQSITRKGY